MIYLQVQSQSIILTFMFSLVTFFVAVGLVSGMHSGGSSAGSSPQPGPSGAADQGEFHTWLLLPGDADFRGPFRPSRIPDILPLVTHDSQGNVLLDPRVTSVQVPVGQRIHRIQGMIHGLDLHDPFAGARVGEITSRLYEFDVPGMGILGEFRLDMYHLSDRVRASLVINNFQRLLSAYAARRRYRLLLTFNVQWAMYFQDDLQTPIRITGNDDHILRVVPQGHRFPVNFPLWPEPGFNPQGEVSWRSLANSVEGRVVVNRGNYYDLSTLSQPRQNPHGPPGAVMPPAAVILFTIIATERQAAIGESDFYGLRRSPASAFRGHPGGHDD